MGYGDVIARESETPPADKQAEVMDFIAFLKQRNNVLGAQTREAGEIEAFFRSVEVDVSGYRFDREEANAR